MNVKAENSCQYWYKVRKLHRKSMSQRQRLSFSVINVEIELLYIRIFKGDMPQNIFLRACSVKHANSEGILQALEKELDSVSPNFRDKIVAMGADGSGVNLGKKQCWSTTKTTNSIYYCNTLRGSLSRTGHFRCYEAKHSCKSGPRYSV